MVSSATNAGPGSFTDGAFAPFAAPAPPSAQIGRLRHTIRHTETTFGIPRINQVSPPNKTALDGKSLFVKVWEDCKGGCFPDVREVRPSGARECTHLWDESRREPVRMRLVFSVGPCVLCG